ncbi:uncharacterized protein METZ01_LOCUS461839, partial [marine metagenome]
TRGIPIAVKTTRYQSIAFLGPITSKRRATIL